MADGSAAAARQKQDDLVSEIIQDFAMVSGSRSNWESHWDEIARRLWPSMVGTFYANGTGKTDGAKGTDEIFDSTASVALGRFAAVVDSLITPQNAKWHRLVASNPELQKIREVRKYFEQATDVLFKYRRAPKANFIGQNHTTHRQLGAFGTGPLFIDQLAGEPGLRYKSVALGQVYFAENHQGIIDRAWRRFPMSPRQMKQRWGEDKLPDQIKSDKNHASKYWVLHCIKPREDRDIQRLDYRGMEYVSYYVSETGRALLEESGYTSFPFAVSRYWQGADEVYGRSPAMEVLPAIKTLNEEKKTILKQGHRTVDPVLLAHDDGVVDGFSLKPGALNSGGVNADGRPLVHALPVGNIAIGKDLMDDERIVINDAFLVSLFQILVETPEMTATEVLERTKEKGILLTPTVGRQQSEYLGPMIERELDVLARQGLLPPMPGVLKEAEGEYNVEYDSPLSRAQRAEEAAGLMRTLEATLRTVEITQDPAPLDHFNWDTIVPEISEINAVPIRWMNDPKVIRAIREQRSQAQQEQIAIQAAPGAAAMAKAQAAVKGKRAA